MKFPIILLCTLMIIQNIECRENSWFPNILEKFTNKTSELTNYVRQRSRNLKNYYVETVRNKLTSYLGLNVNRTSSGVVSDCNKLGNNLVNLTAHEHEVVASDNQARIKRKFNDYVSEAQKNKNIIFDSIAPEKIKFNCTDDDPSIHMTTPQLIALHGYHSESHTVVTDDGYILTLHRIPFPRNETKVIAQKTVLLHHGLLGSSADWVLAGPQKSLAFILSEAGYDVWLANVRGNTYSRAHVSRNIDTFAFWNFTFHDVSQHDLPAVIDYIMELKGWDAKIDYIGHSMGTTVLFALLSTKTQYNKILRAGYALAPVAHMTDIKSPLRLLARFSDNIEYLMKLLGANEFLPQNSVLRWLSKHACEINHYEEVICENSMFVLCGHDAKQFNKTLLPLILGHVPAGASTKTLVHYAQEIKNGGRFQQFDYGPEGNFKQYGTVSPPEYPVDRITLPIALFSADNDWLSSDIDVTKLYVQLVNPIEHYIVPMKEFNHIDFLWAIDAPKLVYARLLQLLHEGASQVMPTVIDEDSFEANVINV